MWFLKFKKNHLHMETIITFLEVFGLIGVFSALYVIAEKSMNNLRKKRLKKHFLKRHALNG